MSTYTDGNFHIRLISSPSELSLYYDWCAAEGWYVGVYDGKNFYAQDPSGFYICEVDGIPVGGMSAVKYGEHLVAIGSYVTKPGFRGKGYGYRMFKEVIERHKMDDKNISLEAAASQKQNYEKWGFKSAWQTTCFRAMGYPDKDTACSDDVEYINLTSSNKVNFGELFTFDTNVFGVARPLFLRNLVFQPGATTIVALKKETNSDSNAVTIIGYGCIRLCIESYNNSQFSRKIGPIFAESAKVASQLLATLARTVPEGIPYYIYVPNDAWDLIQGYDVSPVSETTRMFTKGNYGLQCNKMYAVTSLELG